MLQTDLLAKTLYSIVCKMKLPHITYNDMYFYKHLYRQTLVPYLMSISRNSKAFGVHIYKLNYTFHSVNGMNQRKKPTSLNKIIS